MTNPPVSPNEDVMHARLSFQRCKSHAEFSDTFYDHLAQQSSEIGPMFANTDMAKQNELLRMGIEFLIDYADGRQQAETEIRRIGVIHDRKHHATHPDLYPLWINALKATVLETDEDATPETIAAWERVVAPGIDLMIELY